MQPEWSMSDSLKEVTFKNEISKLGLNDGDTLVDIGCYTGYHDFQLFNFYPNKFFILEDIRYWNDKRMKVACVMIDGQKKFFINNSTRLIGDKQSIPLGSGKYKTVYCCRVLHEFEFPYAMIDELNRIMSVNGILIIEESIPRVEGEIDAGCKKRRLTKKEIIDLITPHGFFLISSDTTTWKLTEDNYRNLNILRFRK